MTKQHFLAFDVETSGCSFKSNGIVSIGCSLQDETAEEVKSFQVNISLPSTRGYEDECLKNFWHKNPQAYDFVQTNQIKPEQAMSQFCTFLDEVEKYGENLNLLSNNPCFDIGWINVYLAQYSSRKPLPYSSKGDYRMIWDTASIQKIWSCLRQGEATLVPRQNHVANLGLKSRWPQDHNPLNDARRLAEFYILTLGQMREVLTSINPKAFA